MDRNPMIYRQGQNNTGSFLAENTQERYVCALCSWYHVDELLLKIIVAKPECHLATLCGSRSLTFTDEPHRELTAARKGERKELGSCGQNRYRATPALRNLPAAEIIT